MLASIFCICIYANGSSNFIIENQNERNIGQPLYIDTSRVYHKGGYINSKNLFRLMLQATYTPIITLTSWDTKQNMISNYLQKKLTSLKIKLQKDI